LADIVTGQGAKRRANFIHGSCVLHDDSFSYRIISPALFGINELRKMTFIMISGNKG